LLQKNQFINTMLLLAYYWFTLVTVEMGWFEHYYSTATIIWTAIFTADVTGYVTNCLFHTQIDSETITPKLIVKQ